MTRPALLLPLALLATHPAFAGPGSAATARPLTLAVSEGTSGGIDAPAARRKYAPLAERLARHLGTEVEVVFVREFAALEQGMKEQRFDFVIARPSDYPARGLRDYRYQFVATAAPDGRCMLAVPAGSPLRSVKELRGKTFVMPEEAAYMTRFCRAELRDQGIDLAKENVFYVREQGAIPFALEKGIADVGGMASYSGAVADWRERGHRILHQSTTQPYLPVVAALHIAEDDVRKAQEALLGLGSDPAGREFLTRLGISAFIADEELRLRKLLAWLGV